jgi:hypothetical protein
MFQILSLCAALAFDPASLPSLDSIGAKTNIRPFMQPCVPAGVQLAALRRAWSADPAIRDFRGLAENDWDFTLPGSINGFGDFDPNRDGSLVAEALGGSPATDEPVAKQAPADRASILAWLSETVLSPFSILR